MGEFISWHEDSFGSFVVIETLLLVIDRNIQCAGKVKGVLQLEITKSPFDQVEGATVSSSSQHCNHGEWIFGSRCSVALSFHEKSRRIFTLPWKCCSLIRISLGWDKSSHWKVGVQWALSIGGGVEKFRLDGPWTVAYFRFGFCWLEWTN